MIEVICTTRDGEAGIEVRGENCSSNDLAKVYFLLDRAKEDIAIRIKKGEQQVEVNKDGN